MSATTGAGVATRRLIALREAEPGAERDDTVSVEEPLEIRLDGAPVAVVMRTPGDDFELVAGFLLTEGILPDPTQLGALSYCPGATPPNERNIVEVRFAGPVAFDREALRRNLYATSSCGVCGKASIDRVRLQAACQLAAFTFDREVLYGLPGSLRQAQAQFARTGSLHAAGLFDPRGRLLGLREDVGRHNAVDKLVGTWVLEGRRPPPDGLLMVSGRTSFEIVQKARLAGIAAVASVSGPSSLAVDLAQESGVTLIGFLRGRSANVYTHPGRLRP